MKQRLFSATALPLTLLMLFCISLEGCQAARSTKPFPATEPATIPTPPARIDRFGDVTFSTSDTRLTFGNDAVGLTFDATTAAWLALTTPHVPGSLISPQAPLTALDFRIDGQWMVEQHGAVFLKHRVEHDKQTGAVSLHLTYGVHERKPLSFIPSRWKERAPTPAATYAPPSNYEFELTAHYTLFPGQMHLERSATLVRNVSKDIFTPSFRHLEGFLFLLPDVVVGDPKQCTVEVPGPVYTYTFVESGTPYEKLAGTFIDCKTAPDRYPGLIAIENKSRHAALGTWVDTKAEVVSEPYLSGDGKRLTLLVHTLRSDRLADSATIDSDVQHIILASDYAAAQAAFRANLALSMPLSKTTPSWAREMVILEAIPSVVGGFDGLAGRLPFYRSIGFNTLYILPHWVGGYGAIDPYQVDPAQGTPQQLKALVQKAHELGMRVLFDMVVHGYAPNSPLVAQHPDFFTHDEHGLPATHFNWASVNTDPASPPWQQYMVDLVLHDLKEYDIDGYRVDAPSYKSPNWDPAIVNQRKPWESMSILRLLRKMYEAMQKQKPDVVFYFEMFGPALHTVCNLAQDANWAVVMDLMAMMDKGQANAATYKAGMASLQDSLQPGVNRIRFCRNHDTTWFFPQYYHGYTPRFLALDAVHALFGVPLVFAGDNGRCPQPDNDPSTWDHYRKIFAIRQEFPEFARGEVLLKEIECDNAWVFSGLRRSGDDVSLALISLSDQPQQVFLKLNMPKKTIEGLELRDAKTGQRVSVHDGKANVGPFQVLTGRLSAAPR